MQFAKDTFFLALRDRMAVLAPEHTVIVDGAARPAVLVTENEASTAAPPLPRAFYLHFADCAPVESASSSPVPLCRLGCEIAYRTGKRDSYGRGRALSSLDQELLCLCAPPHAVKVDATQDPPHPRGSTISWSPLTFLPAEDAGSELLRRARLSIFFYAESAQ